MDNIPHHFSASYAAELDRNDKLKRFRDHFYIPQSGGKDSVYFLGNSLGLRPKTTQDEILKVLDSWANYGVEGFFIGNDPWLDYHKKVNPLLTKILGALESEIVTMNHLTVNLHLLMISFYQPTPTRYKILCEAKAFPSDQYALQSQVRLHGLNPDEVIIKVNAREGTEVISNNDILEAIEDHKDSLALVMIGGVNYYTGQVFDMQAICKAAKNSGAYVGFDLAHAAGNIELKLHDWEVDFACWCNYKYLNSGPGAIAGAFIHQMHLNRTDLKRLEGWWGNDIANRFEMEEGFTPSNSAESWQLSTTPMMPLAAHFASLKIFEDAGFVNILNKSKMLSEYLFFVLDSINTLEGQFAILTPRAASERGCQVSLSVNKNARQIFDQLLPHGIFADWREPDVIRIAPVPLYNTFSEIFTFAQTFKKLLTL